MKFRPLLRTSALAACLAFGSALAQTTLPLPPQLVGLASDEGARLLLESEAHRSYWPLSIHFVTQKNQAYCGVATLVMVLNALAVPAPASPGLEPFRTFTQDNVLDARTERILPQAVLARQGMTLDQFGELATVHGLQAEVHHADASSVAHFRTTARAWIDAADRHVVVNYLRRSLGQETGGHISPLAAYDADSDRFLVLDVSRYKYPPVWVKTADLFAAMDTADADNRGRRRGFVLLHHAAQAARKNDTPAAEAPESIAR